jgi:hypothetical protein
MFDKIKIGHKTFKVIKDDNMTDGTGLVGEINYNKTEIRISPRLEEQSLIDTLVHESIHGMLDFMGEVQKEEIKDEKTTTRITSGILMLIRDNPELFLKFTRSDL